MTWSVPWNSYCYAIIGVATFIGILTAIHRLFFHPLRRFPGPRLAAITPLYKIYYEVYRGGELLQCLIELHKIYGNVIRIAPNEVNLFSYPIYIKAHYDPQLHFNDYAAHSAIYAVGSHFTKDEHFYRSFGANESAFGAIRPQDSRLRRNLLLPLFSRRAILRFEHIIHHKVEKFVSLLAANHQQRPANMMLAFRCLTMEIIASYCFCTSESPLDAQDFHDPFITVTRGAIPSIWIMKCWPSLKALLDCLPQWIAQSLSPASVTAFMEINRMISRYIDRMLEEETLVQGSGSQTIYRHLLDRSTQQLRRSRRRFVEETFSLLQAGSESPGNACAIGTFYVLNDPVIHSKLLHELYTAWPDKDAPVGYCVLEKLPYLTAVIKESLRMSHGIVTPLPRIVGPANALISGYDVPAGTVVGVSIACLNTDMNLFKDPHLFSPERWMQPSSKTLEKYLNPFSKGPRMCIGINLAWCELYLIFGYVFRRLEMNLCDIGDFTKFKDFFTPVYEETYHVHAKVRT
ncbi:Trichodiene oxygenase [Termitomyces sp. J132]|nr:Trichodiene oxygenase [Termitomyces sp. J132]